MAVDADSTLAIVVLNVDMNGALPEAGNNAGSRSCILAADDVLLLCHTALRECYRIWRVEYRSPKVAASANKAYVVGCFAACGPNTMPPDSDIAVNTTLPLPGIYLT